MKTNTQHKDKLIESKVRALVREQIKELLISEGFLDFLKKPSTPMTQISKKSAEVSKILEPIYSVLKKKKVDQNIIDSEDTTKTIGVALKTAKGKSVDEKIKNLALSVDFMNGKVVFSPTG